MSGSRGGNLPVPSVIKKKCVQLIFSYPTALAMIASGKVNVKPLITHRFKLQDSVKAFETVASGEGIKVMISCT